MVSRSALETRCARLVAADCSAVEFGAWSAPAVLAGLASIIHDRQDAARSQ
jgi:hypothetical protein